MNLRVLYPAIISMAIGLPVMAAVDSDLPDQDGMTVKGVVYTGSTPLSGVQVSDGVEVTLTDEKGAYYLPSKKECGYVFICNPKGYKVKQNGLYPQFYQNLSESAAPEQVERFDFELEPVDNTNHTVLMLADMHLARRNEDVSQYNTRVKPDVNQTIQQYKNEGREVYIVTLGDQSFDKYWYTNKWGISETMTLMNRLEPTALYNCMGNHDNDPHVAGDWYASHLYRKYWGPVNYSFNAGDIHYIVLDNIEYLNPGATEDDRAYRESIIPSVLNWVSKDLANVDHDTPVVVCMHVQLFRKPSVTNGIAANPILYVNGSSQLVEMLKEFKDVRFFTGHAHTNFTEIQNQMTEYNVGPVCGLWWWTGTKDFTPNNHLAGDGSVGGYRVVEVNGKEMVTYYKSIAFDRAYQFRAYDLNECNITASRFCPNAKYGSQLEPWLSDNKFGFDAAEYNTDGTPKSPNKILVNVFAYDPRWKVEILEEGQPLKVTRVNRYDPLFILSGACCRLNTDKQLATTNQFNPVLEAHYFEAQASSATSTVTINVTDEYGNIYTEVMTRPKEFSIARYLPGTAGASVAQPSADDTAMPVEYYNMQGLRIHNPTNGLYIRRQGSKTEKVILR